VEAGVNVTVLVLGKLNIPKQLCYSDHGEDARELEVPPYFDVFEVGGFSRVVRPRLDLHL